MGALTGPGSHLVTWARVHWGVLASAALLSAVGAAIAPFHISARTPGMSGPSFSSAILMPCLGATLGIYLSLQWAPLLEAMSARRMAAWRMLQGVLALMVCVGLVVPAAAVAGEDARRIFQNLAVFMAGGLIIGRLTHPIVGIVVPWLWSLGALLFGLSYSDLGQPRWAWWAWIIGESPSVTLPLFACAGAIAATSLLPQVRGNST